ncbi:hypothetical protein DDZ15_16265 [Rhodohalobacter mucosus]|uniref:Uncharacterized protein n=1 Tax=Rhodohalobacter mucosus TaxID=2079485 RepID=A0A316TMV6_9BACT|nr:hypothetical protein DDZ15_16265 [Rhodohalobacter mucosus]
MGIDFGLELCCSIPHVPEEHLIGSPPGASGHNLRARSWKNHEIYYGGASKNPGEGMKHWAFQPSAFLVIQPLDTIVSVGINCVSGLNCLRFPNPALCTGLLIAALSALGCIGQELAARKNLFLSLGFSCAAAAPPCLVIPIVA